MIGWLRGRCRSREGNRAVIDVRDVGYVVMGPMSDVDRWAAAGEAIDLFVSTSVREDAITLYGFSSDRDRIAFERLRGVNGVGPKVALAALDQFDVSELARAVSADDVRGLSRISGVGKKLAQRMALELKGKLDDLTDGIATPEAKPATRRDDALDLALAQLGYTRSEIVRAHHGLLDAGIQADAAIEERLRASLRILSGRS